MILEIIFFALQYIIDTLTGFVGGSEVPLKLPWGMDDIFVQAVSGFKTLAEIFPPFQTVMSAFLIYFLFKICMRLLRAVPILGRTID